MVSVDAINWRISRKMETEYIYSADSKNPNDHFFAGRSNTAVTVHAGAIHIFSENVTMVQIFDLAGRLIKQQPVSVGENRIVVSTGGFYIVKAGNESFKISVR